MVLGAWEHHDEAATGNSSLSSITTIRSLDRLLLLPHTSFSPSLCPIMVIEWDICSSLIILVLHLGLCTLKAFASKPLLLDLVTIVNRYGRKLVEYVKNTHR